MNFKTVTQTHFLDSRPPHLTIKQSLLKAHKQVKSNTGKIECPACFVLIFPHYLSHIYIIKAIYKPTKMLHKIFKVL